jgi:hypothetical protein
MVLCVMYIVVSLVDLLADLALLRRMQCIGVGCDRFRRICRQKGARRRRSPQRLGDPLIAPRIHQSRLRPGGGRCVQLLLALPLAGG